MPWAASVACLAIMAARKAAMAFGVAPLACLAWQSWSSHAGLGPRMPPVMAWCPMAAPALPAALAAALAAGERVVLVRKAPDGARLALALAAVGAAVGAVG